MPFKTRLHQTVDVLEYAQIADGFGGLSDDAANPTTIATGVAFQRYNVGPRDRELYVSRYGVEKDAVMYAGMMDYVAGLETNHVLKVSASEMYRVLGAVEQRGIPATPHHWSVIIMRET